MKVLILLANPFEDLEWQASIDALNQAGIAYDYCSGATGTIHGMRGAEIQITKSLAEIDIKDYDGLMIMGGDGIPALRALPDVRKLVTDFHLLHRPLGAICWAPTLLAEYGLAKGRVLSGCNVEEPDQYRGMTSHDVLRKHGVIVSQKGVSRDGIWVTGSGPSQAKAFARQYAELLLRLLRP